MSIIHDIDEIYENLIEKEDETKNRNIGTLEFASRVLCEMIDDSNGIRPIKKLDFLEIFFNNIIEFIQVRYSEIKNKNDKEEYKSEIESILSVSESILYQFNNKYLPKTINGSIENCSNLKNLFQVIDQHDMEVWDTNKLYFLLGNKYGTEILALNSISPYIFNDSIRISLIDILKRLLFDYNYQWVYPFRIIRNKNFPYYYIENESSYEMLEDLEEVLEQKEKSNIYGIFISNMISLSESEESHIDKFYELFQKDLEIFQTGTKNPIFGGKDLQKDYQILFKNKIGDAEMIQKQKHDIMINLNQVNLYPGILFETPFVSYNTVLYLIHRECYNSHRVEYENKWPGSKVPNTTAIFMSLYRVQKDSDIINDLIHAAKHNIRVFVYIEPMARDNEKENLQIIKRLKKSGVHVVSNFYGIKVHAKAFLSIRSDSTMVAHISTGNYDIRRVGTFTDYQFITQNTEICEEVLEFFKMLIQKQPLITKLDYFGAKERYLKMAPISIRDVFMEECDEKVCQRIYIKCNNLCDNLVIRKLYQASERGVDIKVICRTSCSLIPKNNFIHVRSNTGKYLEHGRFYCFDDRIYIGSADMLLRNLNKRIELIVRVPEGIQILAKHGADLIEKAIETRNPSIASVNYTMENSDEYFIRCFNDAKWIFRKEDFKFKPKLN